MSVNKDKKLVVVTGASGSLGAVVVEQFLALGYQVVGIDMHTANSSKSLESDQNHANLQWIQADLTQPKIVQSVFDTIEKALGGIDVLIHCAGGFRYLHATDAGDQDIDFLVGLNLRSSMYVLREVLGGMKSRNYGRIVFISSKSTLHPGAGEGPYAATKAGINALVSSSAAEVKQYNININAVLPSVIDTPPNRKDMPDADFSRWVEPAKLAQIIVGLTESFGDPIHGALIPVSGRM